MHLKRELGVPGAVAMGLGSILGTGVFVSIGLAAGVAGPAVILATTAAAVLALVNGLNSAQLAASHPVSGGTYEYGYRYLSGTWGFAAGWMFLLAKSASAATAALGFGGYLLHSFGIDAAYRIPLAVAAVALLTLLVTSGLRRSSAANMTIVAVTLVALLVFILSGIPSISPANLNPTASPGAPGAPGWGSLLEATALMFVAFTGYGRIATMGEEVKDPRRTIPRAIFAAVVFVTALYLAVAVVGIGAAGADRLAAATQGEAAPLAVAADAFGAHWVAQIVSLGAITAMLGVLLNLLLGLSRVLFSMGRRRDMSAIFGRLDSTGTSPVWATVGVAGVVGILVCVGDVKTTWSFSAFTVLIYYGITNLAALRLPADERLYPKWLAYVGLAGCFFIAFWVQWQSWVAGLLLLAAGLAWQRFNRNRQGLR